METSLLKSLRPDAVYDKIYDLQFALKERQEVIGNAGAGRRWREGGEGRRGWRAKRREMSGGVKVAVPDTAEVGLKGLEASGEA